MRLASLVPLIMILTLNPAGAEMYRWVDDNGAVTFKDTPPPASKKKKVRVYDDTDFAPAPPPGPADAAPAKKKPTAPAAKQAVAKGSRFTGTVEIYVTDWCGYCKRAQAYMKERGIPFVAYDIEKDRAAEKRYNELHGNGVPLIIVGSKRLNGFSAEGLEHLLETGGR